jgi:hypothetical protein
MPKTKWYPIFAPFPLCMKQLENGETDFYEIQYLEVMLKFVETFQFWLKSGKKNGHFT